MTRKNADISLADLRKDLMPTVGSPLIVIAYGFEKGDGLGGMFQWDVLGGTDDGSGFIVPRGELGSVGAGWRRFSGGSGGTPGPMGPTGPTGPSGPSGPTGTRGETGASFQTVTTAPFAVPNGSETTYVDVHVTDASWMATGQILWISDGVDMGYMVVTAYLAADQVRVENVDCVVNATINTGAKVYLAGAKGANGATGADGPSGPAGPTGPTGAASLVAGPTGPTGATGPQGAASTVAGPTGPTGPTGATGAASTVAGPTGPTGPTGPAGTGGGSAVFTAEVW